MKDYFSHEAKEFNLIAYRETEGNLVKYYIDISHEDETLADIINKHIIKNIVNNDGSVKVKVC